MIWRLRQAVAGPRHRGSSREFCAQYRRRVRKRRYRELRDVDRLLGANSRFDVLRITGDR
jgi:hypothetical protein